MSSTCSSGVLQSAAAYSTSAAAGNLRGTVSDKHKTVRTGRGRGRVCINVGECEQGRARRANSQFVSVCAPWEAPKEDMGERRGRGCKRSKGKGEQERLPARANAPVRATDDEGRKGGGCKKLSSGVGAWVDTRSGVLTSRRRSGARPRGIRPSSSAAPAPGTCREDDRRAGPPPSGSKSSGTASRR